MKEKLVAHVHIFDVTSASPCIFILGAKFGISDELIL